MTESQNIGNEPIELSPLELNDFLKLAGFHQSRSHITTLHYLAMVDQGLQDGYSSLGLVNKSKAIEMKTDQIASSVPKDSFNDLQRFPGINAEAMITNAMLDEDKRFVEKKIFEKMWDLGEKSRKSLITGFWKFALDKFGWDFGTKIKGRSEDQKSKFIVSKIISRSNVIAKKSRRGPADFIVVSAGMAHLITNHPYFCFSSIAPGDPLSPAGIYQIGILGTGIKVFNNPSLPWNDTSVLIGKKTNNDSPGVHLIEYKREWLSIEEPPSPINYAPSTKKILLTRRAIEDVGESASDLFLVEKFRLPKKIFWKFYI